jgi:hypothetical protein
MILPKHLKTEPDGNLRILWQPSAWQPVVRQDLSGAECRTTADLPRNQQATSVLPQYSRTADFQIVVCSRIAGPVIKSRIYRLKMTPDVSRHSGRQHG